MPIPDRQFVESGVHSVVGCSTVCAIASHVRCNFASNRCAARMSQNGLNSCLRRRLRLIRHETPIAAQRLLQSFNRPLRLPGRSC